MISAIAFAAALAAVPTPPRAIELAPDMQAYIASLGRVQLHLGERMVLHLDKDFAIHVDSVERAPARFDLNVSEVISGAVVLTFVNVPNAGGWILKVDNGTPTRLAYGAMTGFAGGKGLIIRPTDTCSVATGKVGVERWEGETLMLVIGPFEARPADGEGCETLALDPDKRPPATPQVLVPLTPRTMR